LNESCYIPPDLSFEPGIIGPFVPADILILSIVSAIGLTLSRFNGGIHYTIVALFTVVGFLLITVKRLRPDAVKTAASFILYVIAERVQTDNAYSQNTGRKVQNNAASYLLEEINFISANQREKERFVSAFIGACSTPGSPVNFVSLPAECLQHNLVMVQDDTSGRFKSEKFADGRLFMATVTDDEQQFHITLLTSKLKRISRIRSTHAETALHYATGW
jgi:hypothetical protein